ncbi:MAG: prepilin-type N-terminal cleavage/methylation domain-containing protein [Candidatus Sumerlaeaceae bacterium]|nr:prepilin-type N-terminal cleavage/methylation domain-containing protein [Candidatus Sumerlaeaceae bacterium]
MNRLLHNSCERAVTLIELLIVVAIIAIFSGGSMAILIAPAQEQAYAGIEVPAETGCSRLFAALVADAHSATAVEHDAATSTTIFRAAADGKDVVYRVDANARLRRIAGAQADDKIPDSSRGSMLIESISEFSLVRQQGNLWRVSVASNTRRMARNLGLHRSLDVAVGRSWSGGTQ